jgi:hypothetical protein
VTRRRPLEFRVAGRYGYYAVDVHDKKTGGMIDTAIAGVTRKEAEIIAGQMGQAYGSSYSNKANRMVEFLKHQDERMKRERHLQ